MIYFLTGENSFELERELTRLTQHFSGRVEKLDVDRLEPRDLADIFTGISLFSEQRMIVLRLISSNTAVWEALPDWLDTLDDATTLVLTEPKPDKRSRTYKQLQKVATLTHCAPWTTKDRAKAERWVRSEAGAQRVPLTEALARKLVQRVGVDQWRLFHALEKLALHDEVSAEAIEQLIESHPEENVFALLETALRADADGITQMCAILRRSSDAYQTFALLGSQILQLAALSYGDKSPDDVARDLNASAYVLSRLTPYAARLGARRARALLHAAAETDYQIKSTGHDPWLHVEFFLLKIARD